MKTTAIVMVFLFTVLSELGTGLAYQSQHIKNVEDKASPPYLKTDVKNAEIANEQLKHLANAIIKGNNGVVFRIILKTGEVFDGKLDVTQTGYMVNTIGVNSLTNVKHESRIIYNSEIDRITIVNSIEMKSIGSIKIEDCQAYFDVIAMVAGSKIVVEDVNGNEFRGILRTIESCGLVIEKGKKEKYIETEMITRITKETKPGKKLMEIGIMCGVVAGLILIGISGID
jgi:hypothetical protein